MARPRGRRKKTPPPPDGPITGRGSMRRPAAKRPALDVSAAAPGPPPAAGTAAFAPAFVSGFALGFCVSLEEDAQAPARRASARCADRTAPAAARGRRARGAPGARGRPRGRLESASVPERKARLSGGERRAEPEVASGNMTVHRAGPERGVDRRDEPQDNETTERPVRVRVRVERAASDDPELVTGVAARPLPRVVAVHRVLID